MHSCCILGQRLGVSVITYNNDPDVFNIFRSEELAKIIRGTLFM